VFKRDRIQTAKNSEREEHIETNEAVRNEFSLKKKKPQRESISSPYMFSIPFISLFAKLV